MHITSSSPEEFLIGREISELSIAHVWKPGECTFRHLFSRAWSALLEMVHPRAAAVLAASETHVKNG